MRMIAVISWSFRMSSPFFTMAPNITKPGCLAAIGQPKTCEAMPVSTRVL